MKIVAEKEKNPFEIKNVRLFILFRIFFNARFYYPVFTILFLDFGLSIKQFAILNAVWAATIVLLEVPSGALADTMGRKNLLVLTGVLMVLEISLLCFAPTSNIDFMFILFLCNRIISGIAEAAASGADEALAYDALKKEGLENEWGDVLEKQMRLQSVAFIFAMCIGAFVYDAEFLNKITDFFSIPYQFEQSMTIRFPLFLTLFMAICTFFITIKMEPINLDENTTCPDTEQCKKQIDHAFKLTLNAGKWILITPFAFVIVMYGMAFDSIVRMMLTLNSQYLRVIYIPEAFFGIISSFMAALGIVIPRLSHNLALTLAPVYNMLIITVTMIIGLTGIYFCIPFWGLFPMVILIVGMSINNFLISYYLNSITSSEQRATVLSFKGLSFNLSYGMIGILYSLLVAQLKTNLISQHGSEIANLEDLVFIKSLASFPIFFLLVFSLIVIISIIKLRGHSKEVMKPR